MSSVLYGHIACQPYGVPGWNESPLEGKLEANVAVMRRAFTRCERLLSECESECDESDGDDQRILAICRDARELIGAWLAAFEYFE